MNLYESIKNNLKESVWVPNPDEAMDFINSLEKVEEEPHYVIDPKEVNKLVKICKKYDKNITPAIVMMKQYKDLKTKGYTEVNGHKIKDTVLKESELQSLFDFITDEARTHYNYAHYSKREIDDQEIKELVKECKKKGREIEPNKYVVGDFIYTIDNSGVTVSENNIDDYKVIGINEAELPKTTKELLKSYPPHSYINHVTETKEEAEKVYNFLTQGDKGWKSNEVSLGQFADGWAVIISPDSYSNLSASPDPKEIKKVFKETYKEYVEDHSDVPDYWHFSDDDGLFIIDIPNGDWKQDHMRCDDIMKLTAEKLGLTFDEGCGEQEPYEEDGSDTYSAEHVWEFELL